jgi:hypothetical protein
MAELDGHRTGTCALSQRGAALLADPALVAPQLRSVEERARKYRARVRLRLGLAGAAVLVIAALAVAIPIGLRGSGGPHVSRPAGVHALKFRMAVTGNRPSRGLVAGERLTINVHMTVPRDTRVTVLWLGISQGIIAGPGRDGTRPLGMRPVLAHLRETFSPGRRYALTLRWTVPAGGLAASATLEASWLGTAPDIPGGRPGGASVGQPIGPLVISR